MSWQTDDVTQGWWNEALADFGRNLGFKGLSGGNSKVHNFSIDDGRYLLDVEYSDDDVVLAVFTEVPVNQVGNKLRLLLRNCNFDRYLPFLVQIGLKGDNVVVLAIRLEQFQANRMFQAFELIRKLCGEAKL